MAKRCRAWMMMKSWKDALKDAHEVNLSKRQRSHSSDGLCRPSNSANRRPIKAARKRQDVMHSSQKHLRRYCKVFKYFLDKRACSELPPIILSFIPTIELMPVDLSYGVSSTSANTNVTHIVNPHPSLLYFTIPLHVTLTSSVTNER